jgi:hypothetical protein
MTPARPDDTTRGYLVRNILRAREWAEEVWFEVECALVEDWGDYCPTAVHQATVQAINAYSQQMATTRWLSTWEWIDDAPPEQFAEAIYTSEEFAAAYTQAVQTCDRCRY